MEVRGSDQMRVLTPRPPMVYASASIWACAASGQRSDGPHTDGAAWEADGILVRRFTDAPVWHLPEGRASVLAPPQRPARVWVGAGLLDN